MIALVQQVVALGAAYVGTVVGWEATNRLRADLMRHCLGLDLPFHKRHTPGVMIERIDGDVTLLANFFSQFTINNLGNALLVVGILAVLSRTCLWLGVGLGGYCLASVAVLKAVRRRAARRHPVDRQASAKQYGAIDTLLRTVNLLPTGGAARMPAGPLRVHCDEGTIGSDEDERDLHNLCFSLVAGKTLGLLGR